MHVAVFGAGAVGGYLAAKLALGGHDVVLVARGAALTAIRAHGLRLQDEKGEHAVRLRAVEQASELGPHPLVIIAVKTYALAAAAPAVATLVGPESAILPAQNGIPWWFPYRAEAPLGGTRISTVDRDGSVTRLLDPARVLGCVVQMAAAVTAPGAVRRFGGNTLVLGEPDGSESRLKATLPQSLSHTASRIRHIVAPVSTLMGHASGKWPRCCGMPASGAPPEIQYQVVPFARRATRNGTALIESLQGLGKRGLRSRARNRGAGSLDWTRRG
jgi:ketopantoate reductase